MSNLIPPLLSSSPPPIVGPIDEDDDDEFGDFRAAANSYDCDELSPPSSPQKTPEKELKTDSLQVNLDINFNKSQKFTSASEMPSQNIEDSVITEVYKDFQDRRKSLTEIDVFKECEIQVNCSHSQSQPIFIDNKEDLPDSTSPYEEPVKEMNQEVNDQNEFSDLHCAAPNSCNDENCIDQNTEVGQSNSIIEEIMFDAFSESIQENTSNSDDLSEINEFNEIKSDNECVEQLHEDITDGDSMKEDKCVSESGDKLSDFSSTILPGSDDLKLSDNDDHDEDDDEFGEFSKPVENEVAEEPVVSEDEFDEFVNSCPPLTEDVEQNDDDFGDFADFSSHNETPTLLAINEKNAADKSETILKDIFPSVDIKMDEFEYTDETKENTVFHELKDVTETKALIYQWSKSNSQKLFFKALNIDTRNILYGPTCNPSMPRFAANLGLTPLEPMKTEILTPIPVQNASSPSNSSQKNSDIPTAQFDWSGSGLINPLDYLEQLVASLDIPSTTRPNSNQSSSPSNELLDEWDLWLQSAPSELRNVPEDASPAPVQTDFLPLRSDKIETASNLFETEFAGKEPAKGPVLSETESREFSKPYEQSDNFSPFQSPKLIPLRETHISAEVNDLNSKPGWLEPTILTPDLPRKETVVDPVDDDEFDDFQMVLPEEKSAPEVKDNTFTLSDLSEFEVPNKPVGVEKNEQPHNHEHIFGIAMTNNSDTPAVQKQTEKEEDEFTDFHSSLPQPQILSPLKPVALEPLKPTLQHSQPVMQINWPDPGVTDEDIQNIELSYSRKGESKGVREVTKENSLEDDEWSDFVSVTNPVKAILPERTATPDLPLSVLNLGQVQAPKQPIPVITPSGLVQTKLSSNMKSVVQTSIQPNLFKPPPTQFQPSTISSQYAANFPGTTSSNSLSTNHDDEDDWSDFVSSQPPPQVNGYQQKSGKPPQINWTNATTNIIMNPTHFETLQNFGAPQKKVPAMPTRHVIPSISTIPDLDFIAPKNRTSKK